MRPCSMPGEVEVVHEDRRAAHLRRECRAAASEAPMIVCCEAGLGAISPVASRASRSSVDELPVGHAAAGAGLDDAVGHRQLLERHAEPLRRALQQQVARFRRGVAQRDAAVRDRLAARGHAFVRAVAGVGRREPDALERHVEFLGDDLRQRGQYPLPDLDLAGEHRDRAVAVDPQPAVEPAVGVEVAGQLARRGCGAWLIVRQLLPPRAGSRAGCGGACRSGTGCPSARRGSRRPTGADWRRAAPWRS